AEGYATRQSTEQLPCAKDCRRLQWNGVAVDAGELRCSTDATAVVQSLAAAVDLAAVDIEAEQSASGDEERPAFIEERLVGTEIEDGRVRLHLPEVRIYGCIERHIRSHAVFHVAAGCQVRSLCERVVDDARRVLGDDVGHRLETARRVQIVQPFQRAELRDQSGFRLAELRPADPLGVPIDVAIDGEAESMVSRGCVTQLRERNPELGGPAKRIDG